MYAERSQGFHLRPASLVAALAINGGVIAALLLANPDIVDRVIPDPPIKLFTPQPDPTPPPPDAPQPRTPHPDPHPTAQLPDRPDTPPPLPPLPADPGITTGAGGGTDAGTGTGALPELKEVVTPLFVPASFDPRYQDELQPPYPDGLRDAGTQGVVRLRILVAATGRVTRVEPQGGDPVLVKVASRHALAHWRFRAATRGGVPEESWKTMVVRFRIDD